MTHTIAVVGLNEDGALSPESAGLIGTAALVAGGRRHLGLAAPLIRGATLAWPSPMEHAIPALLDHPGPVVVLASGDPLWFGAATMLLRHMPADRLRILPAPSSFQIAAARLGWALQDTACLSCCGRPVEAVIPYLQPRAQLLILSAGADTPAELGRLLVARGLEGSIQVLEHLGGPDERVGLPAVIGPAEHPAPSAGLNLVALRIDGPVRATIPLAAGRPDRLFEHDGQITKAEIRAVTLAALAPRRGELLWDVGCGSGAIGIEWMLAHPANRAIALDCRPDRAMRARRNALALGTPGLDVRDGEAPAAFATLPPPDAIFLGGGAHRPGVIDAAWSALRPGGRLVANAIALPTEAALLLAQQRLGGTLTRIGVERLDQVGALPAYRPAMTVTQWSIASCG